MISPVDRLFIEQTKKARKVSLTLTTQTGDTLTLDLIQDKKLYHDIALAIQDYITRQ